MIEKSKIKTTKIDEIKINNVPNTKIKSLDNMLNSSSK